MYTAKTVYLYGWGEGSLCCSGSFFKNFASFIIVHGTDLMHHSKVNGLCICFRQDDIGGRNTPSPKHTRRATLAPSTSSAPALRQQRSGSLKIGDASKHMAGVTFNDQGPPSFRRGSGIPLRRSVSPLASHSQASPSHSPLPSSSPPHGEVATIPSTPPLTSSPPPPDGRCDTQYLVVYCT